MAGNIVRRNPIARLISLESGPGPVVLSILAHAALYVAVIGVLKVTWTQAHLPPEAVTDLEYQTFDAPPEPAKEVKRVVSSVEPVVQAQVKPMDAPAARELQDEKGVVAGTQAAQPTSTVGSTSQGTADATPYYKIKPKYPREALVSGTEGWVLLQIDINEKGEVENVRVVDGEQRNTFQNEARRAVGQWKYKPFIDPAGKPFRKQDHQVRIDFKLSDVQSANM